MPVRKRERLAHLGFNGAEGSAGGRHRGQIELDVETVEFEREPRIVHGTLQLDVSRQRTPVAVDEIQFEFGAEGGITGPEPGARHHAAQGLEVLAEAAAEREHRGLVEFRPGDFESHGRVGVLASVAVPSFLNYQLTSKRAEAYANLAALAKMQKGYYAEFDAFVASAPEAGATDSSLPTTVKRDVTSLTDAYATLGWTPDSDVFFDYDTVVGGVGGCSCTTCFTATAYGNLDGDNLMSEVVYFHPDATGNSCDVGVSGHGPPTDPVSGLVQWDAVVRHPSSDYY